MVKKVERATEQKRGVQMNVGEEIKRQREKKGYSAEALARRLGVSRQTVYRYESGAIANIPREKLFRLAEALDVPPSLLAGYGGVGREDVLSTHAVPLLGEIACGAPVYADGGTRGFALMGGEEAADFCLRARGDSMTGARIFDGDLVFVHAQSSVDNGEIGAVVIGDEATLKRIYYYPEQQKLILVPENAAYEPLVYIGEELEGIKILGKAVAFQSAVR